MLNVVLLGGICIIVKKFWVLILVFSILSIGPASAVQIRLVTQFNINDTISDKNLENNNTTLDDNITTILNDNNSTVTNQTIINGTIELNETLDNHTNDTEMNETVVLNKTSCNDTNKTETIFNTKGAIIGTLGSFASICGVITTFAFAATVALAAVPDPSLCTKVLAVGCGLVTLACVTCTLTCTIASIFCWWLM